MRIFISSTKEDLSAHRAAVFEHLKRLGHEVIHMEEFYPGTIPPINECYRKIDTCDLLVGIYAYWYGSVHYLYKYSFTELEYHYARKKQKRIICFVHDENTPWLPKFHEKNEESRFLLLKFKENIQKKHIIGSYSDPHNLANKVSEAVKKIDDELLQERFKYIQENDPASYKMIEKLILKQPNSNIDILRQREEKLGEIKKYWLIELIKNTLNNKLFN